jgi:hypothetical protein
MVIIDVPEDFRTDFENNLEDSIRDIGGVETVTISPFIQQRDKIIPCIDKSREHPFSTVEWVQTEGGKIIWPRVAHQVDIREGAEVLKTWEPIHFPGSTRHVHIDPSVNTDCTGIAVGCVAGYKQVVRRDPVTHEQHVEHAPMIWVDFVLRIRPPIGGEIDHGLVRSIVYQFQAKGFAISLVTMDQFNSTPSLQKFATKGITAERISVDKPLDAYDTLKTAIYENRISFYEYEPLLEELRTIQRDVAKNKVDHPRNGSKDIADSLAGIVFTLSTMYHGPPMGVIRGISQYADPVLDEQRKIVDDSDLLLPFIQG